MSDKNFAEKLIQAAESSGSYSFDIEHDPGEDMYSPGFELWGCSFASADLVDFVRDPEIVSYICKRLFPNSALDAIAYNLKYDIKGLMLAGLITQYPAKCADPMLAINLLDDNLRANQLGLKDRVKHIFGHTMAEFADTHVFGPDSLVFSEYAKADASWELRIWLEHCKPLLEKEGLLKYFERISMRACRAFADVEISGIGWDTHRASDISKGFQHIRGVLHGRIISELGDININSGDQVARKLFEELKYSTHGIPLTKSGKRYAVDESAMATLSKKYPVCQDIVYYRTAEKMLNTYMEPLTKYAEADPNSRIHPTYWLTSATGRTRCEKPNFQNCFPGDVEVLTNVGWVRFDEYVPLYRVMQFNLGNGELSWAPTVERLEQDYEGPVTRITGFDYYSVDITATPDHDMVVFENNTYVKVAIKDLKQPATLASTGRFFGGEKTLTPEQCVFIAASHFSGRITEHVTIFKIKDQIQYQRLKSFLESLEIHYSEDRENRDIVFQVEHVSVPQEYRENTLLGPWIFELDWDSRARLCNEFRMWHSAGPQLWDYPTEQQRRADWTQILWATCGVPSRNKTAFYSKKPYCITVPTSRMVKRYNRLEKETLDYSGKVYCVRVPDGAVVVRSKGTVLVVGNCPAHLNKVFSELNIRSCVVPARGKKLIVADYSQIELRLMAHLTQDPKFLRAYRRYNCTACGASGDASKILHKCPECGQSENEKILKDSAIKGFYHGEDLHAQTAARVAALSGDRQLGKICNFALVYYATAGRMHAEFPQASYSKWEEIIEEYFYVYSGVREWHMKMQAQMYATGVCKDIFGRKRRIPKHDIVKAPKHALNQFINFPAQASACGIGLLAMSTLSERWRGDGRLRSDVDITNFVHDELVFEVVEDKLSQYMTEIKDAMESAVTLSVPIAASLKVCDNWSEK